MSFIKIKLYFQYCKNLIRSKSYFCYSLTILNKIYMNIIDLFNIAKIFIFFGY